MSDARAVLEPALSGAYAFERELGRGGMATVYLARDLKHDRLVALKVLLPELAQHLGAERFQREIHLAARLQHPHILSVHDSGEAAGQLWFTMPFVEGESLRDRLRRERQLSVDEALRISGEVARALDYAHEHGVVHRDIKPENILLTRDGSTLVADFGIARALDASDNLTQTGMAIGTPAYMSPEQATGDKAVDARSDTYSLAAVLYEMLAGEPPYTGPTAQAVIAKRFTDPVPSVRRARPRVPEPMDQAIQQAMAPLAADRFASTGEFVRALTAAHAEPAPAHADRAVRRFPVPAVGLVALLVIGALAFMAWNRPDRPAASGPAAARSVRVVVLPFENRGDSGDAYFADGMAEAIRAKLTNVPGLAVIARASSESYAKSATPLVTIARELGVDFLLAGTVRWARAGTAGSRVQVNPELIEVVKGQPETRWQQAFDAPVTDVFEVQGDIASKVAGALDIHLAPQDAQRLVQRPTENLAAYDAFLKGAAVYGWDLASVRRATAHFREAALLDTSFAWAWAAWAHGLAFIAATPSVGTPALRDSALRVLARAVMLDSTSIATYRARMQVAHSLTNDDAELAAALGAAVARYPNEPIITRAAGITAGINGKLDSAVVLLARAADRDPRSYLIRRQYGELLNQTGRTEEAREQLGIALGLAGGDYATLKAVAQTWITAGNLDSARHSIAAALEGQDGALFGAYLAGEGLHWLLSPAQQDAVMRLPAAAFSGNSGGRALAFGQVHYARGDTAEGRRWGEIAYRLLDANGTATGHTRSLAAIALAQQRRCAEAIRQGKQGLMASPAIRVKDTQLSLAMVYAMCDEPEKALDSIELALAAYPSRYFARTVTMDPGFASLRGSPRLVALTTRL